MTRGQAYTKIKLMNSFGKVALLKEAWGLFKKHINVVVALIAVYFVYYIAQYILGMVLGESILASLISLVFSIAFMVIQLGAYNLMLKIVDGKPASLKDLYTYPDPVMKIIRNIVAGILVGLAVVGGLILFIIPGIYVAVRLMFYTYYIVDKNAGVMDSIKMSWNLTKGGVMNLFLLGILFFAVNFVGALILGIGLAVTLPLTFLATALLYRKFQK